MDGLCLKRCMEAPESGWMLAYTRKSVIMEPYKCAGEWQSKVEKALKNELLELHLFDEHKEYRCLKTRSKRFADGWIETVADFKNDPEYVFRELVYLEPQWQEYRMAVLNHVSYDESGMCYIDNYRLYMTKETEGVSDGEGRFC